MFLNKLKENNPELIEYAFKLSRNGDILPDTYVLDLDAIIENGRQMVEVAKPLNIDLFFMLKQIGRNPFIAKQLIDIGFKGCIAVDYKEALLMIENGIHISNVGHLVQIPDKAMDKIIASRPDFVTVYSLDIIKQINDAAIRNNIKQKVLIRISDDDAMMYSGQVAGFDSRQLEDVLVFINDLSNVEFGGITVFPALLFDEKENKLMPTDNMKSVERAKAYLDSRGYKDYDVNLPSASCCASIPLIKQLGGTSCEPGHGLTGTTPLHAVSNQKEKQAYVYVSETSHNYNGKSYCYAGGHYRRSHMSNCLVGTSLKNSVMCNVKAPSDESIDYTFELDRSFDKGLTCLMAFRTQLFVTRSDVALVKGLSENNPQLVGLYTCLGEKKERNW